VNAHHELDLITVYRELTAAEIARVQAHVTQCRACAQALAQARRVDALLGTLPSLHQTPAQAAAVQRRVYAAPRPTSGAALGRLRQPMVAWLIVLLLMATLLGSTGVAAAASLPDTPLYPLKLAGEQARGWLIWDAAAQAEWQLARVRTRVDEINRLLAQGRLPSRQALARIQEQLATALASAAHAPLPDTVRLLQQADGMAGDALAHLNAWQQQAPALATDDLEDLRAALRQQQRAIDAGLAAPEKFRQPAAPTPTRVEEIKPTPTPTSTATTQATSAPQAPTAAPLPTNPATPTWTPAITATDSPTPAPSATPSPTASALPSATPTPRPRIIPPRPSTTPGQPPRPRRTPLPTPTPAGSVTPGPTPTAAPTGGHVVPPVATRTPPPRRTPFPPPHWPPGVTPTPPALPTERAAPPPTPTPGAPSPPRPRPSRPPGR